MWECLCSVLLSITRGSLHFTFTLSIRSFSGDDTGLCRDILQPYGSQHHQGPWRPPGEHLQPSARQYRHLQSDHLLPRQAYLSRVRVLLHDNRSTLWRTAQHGSSFPSLSSLSAGMSSGFDSYVIVLHFLSIIERNILSLAPCFPAASRGQRC